MRRRRFLVVAGLMVLFMLATVAPAYATGGDILKSGQYYSATTHSSHGRYPGFGSAVDINGASRTSLYVSDFGWAVYAPGPGSIRIVTCVGSSWGNAIVWTSADGRERLFIAHLSRFGKTGTVGGGEIIGYVGGTGRRTSSYTPHLHVERQYRGQAATLVLSGHTICPLTYPNARKYLSLGPDGTAPAGSITAPVAGSVIPTSGVMMVGGVFTDEFKVSRVSFYWRYSDELTSAYRLIGTVTNPVAMCSVPWTHTLTAGRTVVIQAIPIDSSGNQNRAINAAFPVASDTLPSEETTAP